MVRTVLELDNDTLAALVTNQALSQEERQAAYDELKRRGLFRKKRHRNKSDIS